MGKYESKFEQTGNLFEWQFIGEVDTNSYEYQKELYKLQKESAEEGVENDHIPYEKAVKLAKKFQPFDPTHPNKPFARDIRISLLDLMINKKLITESEEDQDRIKFYTAVKTPLDIFHGIDAFIEFEDSNKKKHLVTFDLTINPQKIECKSDIIVTELPDPDLKEETLKYNATIERYAQKALGCIEMRKSNEENKEKGFLRD
ncbi:hypothetical protein KJ671_01485 [Patescibacteria group bacterium]|nr:hypothetical protein [Patescibacteria group bacterium]